MKKISSPIILFFLLQNSFADVVSPVAPIDRWNIAEVVNAFAQIYMRAERTLRDEPLNWTGKDFPDCIPGTINPDFLKATLTTHNYFRAVAGVSANVFYKDILNEKAQAAALISHANNRLSHFPDETWKCYSLDARDGARGSNLTAGPPAEALKNWIEDFPETTSGMGHRINSFLPYDNWPSGFGTTTGRSALFVTSPGEIPHNTQTWVAWPSPGYFPRHILPNVWTYWAYNLDLSTASVTMQVEDEAPQMISLIPQQTDAIYQTVVWIPPPFFPTITVPLYKKVKIEVSVKTKDGVDAGKSYEFVVVDPEDPNIPDDLYRPDDSGGGNPENEIFLDDFEG